MAVLTAKERTNLLQALRQDLRLLVPGDPGPARLLEFVRRFDPRSRHASGGRIDVGNTREVYLSSGVAIDRDVAAAAGVPAAMTFVYFVQHLERRLPLRRSGGMNYKKELRKASIQLVNGLAVRMGGIAWPGAPVLGEPLEARIYMFREANAGEVYEVAAKYSPGLAPHYDVKLASMDVSAWRTEDGQFRAEFWPRGKATQMSAEMPRAIGGWYVHPEELGVVRLQLLTSANAADPRIARLLGECALEVAAEVGGVCVDQLGFRVERSDELVFG